MYLSKLQIIDFEKYMGLLAKSCIASKSWCQLHTYGFDGKVHEWSTETNFVHILQGELLSKRDKT